MANKPILQLEQSLYTDYSGIKRLFNLYHQASEHFNTTIYIDFYSLQWLDANMSALLGAILYKLKTENNLTFSTDLNFVNDKFCVLLRNGFLTSEEKIIDHYNSTISFRDFDKNDKDGFVTYIENELLSHRGMPKLNTNTKDNILNSLIEVFCNIQIHSKTENPFFVCGQYYPKNDVVIFTIVDLGVGFLPAINLKTKGEITNSFDAIKWSLQKGNTTKDSNIGGIGLCDLYEYFKKSDGNIQIITGDTFWEKNLEKTIFDKRNFDKPFVGSILNLFFNCK